MTSTVPLEKPIVNKNMHELYYPAKSVLLQHKTHYGINYCRVGFYDKGFIR